MILPRNNLICGIITGLRNSCSMRVFDDLVFYYISLGAGFWSKAQRDDVEHRSCMLSTM